MANSEGWSYAAGLDDMRSTGSFLLQFRHSSTHLGLPSPVCDEDDYIAATLIVTESGSDNKLQKNRLIGQTLILPLCNDGRTHIYTRTQTCTTDNNGWQPWVMVQQNVDVGQVSSLDTNVDSGIYSGVYTDGSFYETFSMVVIDNKTVARANGCARSVSQFKYSLNIDGTFSCKTRIGCGNDKITWGNWVDMGAADTTDIQDNSITAQKLSIDLREKIDKTAVVSEQLISVPFTENNKYFSLSSLEVGNVVQESIISANGYSYAKIKCKDGEKYYIHTVGNTTSAKSFAIIDKNNVVLSVGDKTALTNELIDIPEGGAILIVNSKIDGGSIKKNKTIPVINIEESHIDIEVGNNSASVIPESYYWTNVNHWQSKFYISTGAVGQETTISYVAANSHRCIFIPVRNGERYRVYVSGSGTSSAKALTVMDADMIVLRVEQTRCDEDITIEQDGYIVVNHNNINAECYVKKFGEVVEVTRNIPYTKEGYYLNHDSIGVVGTFYSPTEVLQNGYCYARIKVSAGQMYKVATIGSTAAAKAFILYDNDMKVLQIQTSSVADRYITVWADGWLIINSKTDGYSLTCVDTSIVEKLSKEVFNYLTTRELTAEKYNISEFNNIARLDDLYAGDLRTNALYLEYNRNIPTKGAVISTDVFGKTLPVDHSIEQAQAFYVPYLFYNQQKVGTILLFDEITGEPFFFDKDGVKKYITIKSN